MGKSRAWWWLMGLAFLDLVSFVIPVFSLYTLVCGLLWPEGLSRAARWLDAAAE